MQAQAWRSVATHVACTRCDASYALDERLNLCACGAPLSTQYDVASAARTWDRDALARRPADLWRYREMLPLQDPSNRVTLGEGMTPLLEMPRLSERLGGRRVLLKDDSLNPTNSFKSRGMAVAVSRARELGCTHLALPSAGNAGGALAAYAARAGLRASVFVPRDTSIAFVDECRAHGADVELVDGLIDDCGRRVAAGRETHGWFDMSTL